MIIVKHKDTLKRDELGSLILDGNGNPQIENVGDVIATTTDDIELIKVPDNVSIWDSSNGKPTNLRVGVDSNENPALIWTDHIGQQYIVSMTPTP
jgi:hypothetical protein